ncbi:MAG: formylglycine-generating enzyme family protein [Treponema sp.]|jgi:formylglycine-generating enzyme required for sulfatase activity|nr:formylglycine-generating enzyme family protein [Treponema sp.]
MKNKKKNVGSFATVKLIAFVAVIGLTMAGCGKVSSSKSGMVWVPGGTFEMGKDLGTDATGDVTPVHMVTLSGFYLGKYPVTQAQYQAVMGKNPSYFHGGLGREPAAGEVQEKRPVECVSWYDAIVFCNKLSMAEGLTPAYRMAGSTNPDDWGAVPENYNDRSRAKWDAVEVVGATGYRLPTEVQWEYAAKGGKGSPKAYTYSGSNTAGDVAWYADNSGEKTHEVGKKKANGLGLYDMSGNVWEWCWDWYGGYSSDTQTDPTGAVSGDNRVIRGGCWIDSAEYVRSAGRYLINRDYPGSRDLGIGFRLVRP